MTKTRIFVSYSRKDQKILAGETLDGEEVALLSFLQLLEKMEEPAIEVFVDKEIATGERWEDRLEAELQQADIVLALVSENSLGSQWCRQEIEIAQRREVVIFPLILTECPWRHIRWVRAINVMPPDGKTVAGDYRQPTARRQLYNEMIDSLVRRAKELETTQHQPLPEISNRRAERRPVTELRCLPPGLDGESEPNWEHIESVHERVEQVVAKLGGATTKESDGSQIARFGYPKAQERAAQRAVLAALEIGRELAGSELAPGIGIHSAQVVVREAEGEAKAYFYGRAGKRSAQLAERARPGEVLLSEATRSQVERFIRCQALEPIAGSGEEVVYRAVEELTEPRATGEIVGRGRELEELHEHWLAAGRGRGRVVLIAGGIGLGKSRLLAELKRRVLGPKESSRLVEWRASPFHKSRPLYPALAALRRYLGLERREGAVDGIRLAKALDRVGLPVAETAPLLADLLQIELPGDFPAPDVDPRRKMRRTQEALLDGILTLSESGTESDAGEPRSPLMWWVEDLQWADPDTLDLLDLAARSVSQYGILMVCTFRPEEFSPRSWRGSHLLEIGALADDQIRQIVTGILTTQPDAEIDELVAKAGGIPLWAEELARATLEGASSKELPGTLQAWLGMRLDRLGSAKEIAQCAAVLGLKCTEELLLPVSGMELEQLEKQLDRLVTRGILKERRDWRRGEFVYEFHSTSYQEAAYRTLVDEDLQRLHLAAAEALIALPRGAREPEQVARHLQAGGDYRRAVEYWRRAGDRAFQRSYARQAKSHLEHAQHLLEDELEDDSDRARLELSVQETLGPALATSEFASEEVRRAYRRALELRQESGLEGPFWVLWGYWRIHFALADLDRALSYARSLVHLAEPAEGVPMGHPMTRIAARFTTGATLFCLGRFQEALAELETGIGYDTEDGRRQWAEMSGERHYAQKTGEDAGVANLLWAGWSRWFLGFHDTARRRCDQAVELAEKLQNRYTEAYAKVFAAALAYHMGDRDRVQVLATEAVKISEKYGSWWGAPGKVLLGWYANNPSRTRKGVDEYFATHARLHMAQILSILAEVETAAGWRQTAVRRLDACLSAVADTGERYFKAEIYRRRAALAIADGNRGAAFADLTRAVEIARRQGARTLGLRALTDLVELVESAGKVDHDYRTALAELYDSFTEGFDAPDLSRALKVLDRLGTGLWKRPGAAAQSYLADIVDAREGLRIDRWDRAETPGNVAICLSGGGMRTVSAGLGQLQALRQLKLRGRSLLSQAKVFATSSGGSLLGAPYTYLGAGDDSGAGSVSDDDFLGPLVAPEDLRPTLTGAEDADGERAKLTALDYLPPGHLGHVLAEEFFHVRWIAVTMILLRMAGVPPHRLSNTSLGLHILKPYGLFEPGDSWRSRRTFARSPGALDELEAGGFMPFGVGGDPSRERRPFFICNFSMYLEAEGDPFKYLIPVQANPVMTGIVGRPEGVDARWVDANGRRPGAGGVSSFAFGGVPQKASGGRIQVKVESPLSLADVMGTSFAAFALVENLPSSAPDIVRQSGIALVKLLADWQLYPEKLHELLEEHGERFWGWLEPHVPAAQRERLRAFVAKPRAIDFRRYLPDLKALSPEFRYWPVNDVEQQPARPSGETDPAGESSGGAPVIRRTRFGDSGLLENTAIPSVLAYSDVERIIAFVNSDTPLKRRRTGVVDARGEVCDGTAVEVDWMVPSLFGYHPHDRRRGYRLFGDEAEDRQIYPDPNGKDLLFSQFRHNQVFKPERFPELVRGLWRNCRDSEHPGAIVRQELEVVDNAWYGVRGGRKVTVVWVYLGLVKGWYKRLQPEVRSIVRRLSGLSSIPHRFPHGDTFETGGMTATQTKLLANMAGWVVACRANRNLFLELFESTSEQSS